MLALHNYSQDDVVSERALPIYSLKDLFGALMNKDNYGAFPFSDDQFALCNYAVPFLFLSIAPAFRS